MSTLNPSTTVTTPRDLVYQALHHTQPAQIPWTLYLSEPVRKQLNADPRGRQALQNFDDDTVRMVWELEKQPSDEPGFVDAFGVRWVRTGSTCYFVDPPMMRPDVNQIPRIDLLPPEELQRIGTVRTANPDKFVYYQFAHTFGARLWSLRGLDQYLMDLVEHPRFIHEALDVLMQMHLDALDDLIQLPVDAIVFSDDFGAQNGLMISPQMFRLFYKDRLAILFKKVIDAGIVVGAHSCGDNTTIMRDSVEIGLQMFHPLQAECMDVAAIKQEYGKDLTFRGGLGVQRSLVHGTPQEIRAEVMTNARSLSVGGGYLMEPCKPFPIGTSLENAIAFIEALQQARHYDFTV